jgi:hypothetical protein
LLALEVQAPSADVAESSGIAEQLTEVAEGILPDEHGWVVFEHDVDIEPMLLNGAKDGIEVQAEVSCNFDSALLVEFGFGAGGPFP